MKNVLKVTPRGDPPGTVFPLKNVPKNRSKKRNLKTLKKESVPLGSDAILSLPSSNSSPFYMLYKSLRPCYKTSHSVHAINAFHCASRHPPASGPARRRALSSPKPSPFSSLREADTNVQLQTMSERFPSSARVIIPSNPS